MKLEQEQLKKIGVSVVVLAVLLYSYFNFLLDPLKASEQRATAGLAALGPQIEDGKKQIAATADLEKKAPEATAFLKRLKDSVPDGAPIAWFPPKMTVFFKKHGIEKCTTRLMSEAPDSKPGFRRLVWAVDVPRVEFVHFGAVISTLENEEPLLNILDVSIEASRDDAEYQHASMTLCTLVKS
jgi:hypothetical protein